MSLFYCATSRASVAYPIAKTTVNSSGINTAIRTDYAANAGTNQNIFWTSSSSPPLPSGGDPSRYAKGFPDMSAADGVIYTTSWVSSAELATNGTSNTFMFGEKYLDPMHNADGLDPGDKAQIYAGFGYECERWGGQQSTTAASGSFQINSTSSFTPLYVVPQGPAQSRKGMPNNTGFGSAHVDGLNMFTCDQSGHWVSYNIDPTTFAMMSSRANVNPVDTTKRGW